MTRCKCFDPTTDAIKTSDVGHRDTHTELLRLKLLLLLFSSVDVAHQKRLRCAAYTASIGSGLDEEHILDQGSQEP